nr:MAG TPA: Protein of unknown function (DUF3990) [Caudoviricetes sp.]
MLTLTNGMLLYHGSFTQVSEIDLNKCKQGKDFGRGFYVTSSYKQAQGFVPLSVNKQVNEERLPAGTTMGYISVFKLHLNPDIAIHLFNAADRNWLHFVASNRRRTLFPDVREQYAKFDIIGGKIADDQTARTLQLYTTRAYGEPGSEDADSFAIKALLPNRLEDQFCFCNEKAIQSLEFVRSDLYDFKHL